MSAGGGSGQVEAKRVSLCKGPPVTYVEVFAGSSNLQVRVAQFTKQPM